MNVESILKINSLIDAKLIAGKSGIQKEVSGVNVLEAIDIENWGHSGEVILTSYFALQNLDEYELEIFFEKLDNIGISAIIIKIDRLVNNIPQKIVDLCDKHIIPLIQIGKEVKYEWIILEILGPIIDRNVQLLNKYYEVHSELTSLSLKMPSLDTILYEFKKMILRDISLVNSVRETEVTTNPSLKDFIVLNKSNVINEKYMQFKYERHEVIYNNPSGKIKGTQLRVHIPNLSFEDYQLIIHEISDQLSSEDFMVVENAVKFLQMELLKKHVISQNLFQQKNNLISDLLNDRIYDYKTIDEVLETLEISKNEYYQIVLISLYPENENKNLDKKLMLPVLANIRNKFKTFFKNMAFLERSDRIVFIFNLDESTEFTTDFIDNLLKSFADDNLFKEFNYRASISSKVKKVDISKANKEVLDTQKILRLFHDFNKVMSYEQLGIYKLFLESNNLYELQNFISPKIRNLWTNHPQLFETVVIFLDSNQSYTATAEKLFLHPKTVRYRIEKAKDILNTDFREPEEVLQIKVASRLFRLIAQEATHE